TVTVGPAVDSSLFATEGNIPPLSQGGGSFRPVDPASRPPGTFWELPGSLPDGYTRQGRYAVVPPQPENFSNPGLRSNRLAGVSDVLVRGPDVIVVDRGGTLGGVDP